MLNSDVYSKMQECNKLELNDYVLLHINNINASFKNQIHTTLTPQIRSSQKSGINNSINSVSTHSFQLRNISFVLNEGECLGLVGESGSGKSLLAKILLGLESNIILHSGDIHFNGYDLLKKQGIVTLQSLLQNPKKANSLNNSMQFTKNSWRKEVLGKEIAYIPQDTLNSLNPLHKVGKQIEEMLDIHGLLPNKKERQICIHNMCQNLEIDSAILNRYPHELSGGQRQRIIICMALIVSPKLIICDEPTTALDTNLSFQIVRLLKEISQKMNIAILFITHDLGLLRFFCDKSLIIKNGEIVELFKHNEQPQHEYTRILFEANCLTKKQKNSNNASNVLKLEKFSVGVKKYRLFKNLFKDIISNVNLELQQGKTLGIIGESGSGKSSLAQGILHLMDTRGNDICCNRQISYNGMIHKENLKAMRQTMQVVFQDSASALNPRLRVYDLVAEGLLLKYRRDKQKIDKAIQDIFAFLKLDERLLGVYPSQLSGGQKQRVAIARSMVLQPKILVLDEPTSALDKVIQKETLKLLSDMQKKFDLSYILITHDLDVMANLCDDVVVVSHGKIVERGSVDDILTAPKHHYTQKMVEIHKIFNSK